MKLIRERKIIMASVRKHAWKSEAREKMNNSLAVLKDDPHTAREDAQAAKKARIARNRALKKSKGK